jgi:signal peptidase I
MKKALSLAFTVIVCALTTSSVFVVWKMYGVTFGKVKGESMLPTYREGDVVMLHGYPLLFRTPRKGEIVALWDRDNIQVIKRIARVPGEVDDISPYKPRVLQKNEYIVLGDNRDNSTDSRDYGTVIFQQIRGIVQ